MQELFPRKPGNVLLLDWDGTLTTRSTLSLIASIRPDAPALSTFTKAYEADLAEHAAKWKRARRTIQAEAKYAEDLKKVELASIKRLEAAGVWKGVTGPQLRTKDGLTSSAASQSGQSDVEKAAREAVRSKQVELRPGAAALLRAALRRRDFVFIISVAWSGSWIAACLRELGIPAWSAAQERHHARGHAVIVIANEIDPAGSGRLGRGYVAWADTKLRFDGRGEDGVWTAVDKQVLADIWDEGLRKGTRTACLGDSLGDLQLFLEKSDAGGFIVVDDDRTREQRELEEVLQRLQIQVQDIKECSPDNPSWSNLIRVTEDLTPVVELLYGANP